MIDKSCSNGLGTDELAKAQDSKGKCVSAPEVKQLSQDSCVLAVSLAAIGFGAVVPSKQVSQFLEELAGRTSYSPIRYYAEVKSADVVASNQNMTETLNEMGVTTSPSDKPTYLEVIEQKNLKETKVLPFPFAEGATEKYYGEMKQIDALPKPMTDTSPNSIALTHPEMADYLKKVKAAGYQVVIDTSLPYTGASAYFDKNLKVIAIRPNSTWSTFRHEYEHLEFYETVAKDKRVEKMILLRAHGKNLSEALPSSVVQSIGKEKLEKIQALIDRGVTPTGAIDESLAYGKELELLGWKRFIPEAGGSKIYQNILRHQISDLEKLGDDMSPQQRNLLERNKQLYQAASIYDGGVAITGMAAGAAVSYEALTHQYSQIYHDQNGNVLGVASDGHIDYLKTGARFNDD
jgi:hypothetical protein